MRSSPESDIARHFSDLVQTFIQSGYKDQAAEAQIRMWLTIWRDNDARLHPLLSQTYLLQEDVPLSQDLSALGVGRPAGARLSRQRPDCAGFVEDAADSPRSIKPKNARPICC